MLKFIILTIIIVLFFHCITSQKHSNNEPQKFNLLKKNQTKTKQTPPQTKNKTQATKSLGPKVSWDTKKIFKSHLAFLIGGGGGGAGITSVNISFSSAISQV